MALDYPIELETIVHQHGKGLVEKYSELALLSPTDLDPLYFFSSVK